MGMTIVEKILADHAGVDSVAPGDFIMARVDMSMAHDMTAPISISEFRRSGAARLHDPRRLVFILDHFTPCKDISAAQASKEVREFAREQGVAHFYDVGRAGICHAFIPEAGLVLPGDLVIGADSHTCTYGALGAFAAGVGSTDLAAVMALGEIWLRVPESIKVVYKGAPGAWIFGKDLILDTIRDLGVDGAQYAAIEFWGEAIASLPMDDRFTMCNMAVEAGAKCGVMEADETTQAYVAQRSPRPGRLYKSDPDAVYSEVRTYDISSLEPMVAIPCSPANAVPVGQVTGTRVDQCVIGSCTNGRMRDLRVAAQVLNGRQVAPYTRLIVIPATQSVYRQAMDEGLMNVFIDAGATISPPTCGPCFGGHMGILADGEVAVSTTNRNFVGRMGHASSQVYLANPAVVAASAIAGQITDPREVMPDD